MNYENTYTNPWVSLPWVSHSLDNGSIRTTLVGSFIPLIRRLWTAWFAGGVLLASGYHTRQQSLQGAGGEAQGGVEAGGGGRATLGDLPVAGTGSALIDVTLGCSLNLEQKKA